MVWVSKSAKNYRDEYDCIYIQLGVLRLTEGTYAKHIEGRKGSQMNINAIIFILFSKMTYDTQTMYPFSSHSLYLTNDTQTNYKSNKTKLFPSHYPIFPQLKGVSLIRYQRLQQLQLQETVLQTSESYHSGNQSCHQGQ